jgi:hypothetical protein
MTGILCLLGEVYKARGLQGLQQRKSIDLKEALNSYQKGHKIYKSLHQEGALPFSEISELDRVEREIARCTAALNKRKPGTAKKRRTD